MRILIDTNVLVSAARSRGVANQLVLHVVRHAEFDWLATDEVLDEYWRSMAKPKLGLLPGQIVRWQQIVKARISAMSDPSPEFQVAIRDPKDAMWVRAAIVGGADCLITGDRDFDPLKGAVPFRIVTPAEFLALIGDPE